MLSEPEPGHSYIPVEEGGGSKGEREGEADCLCVRAQAAAISEGRKDFGYCLTRPLISLV